MHDTAILFGKAFFECYLPKDEPLKVLDVGSFDVNGTLRQVAPSNVDYTGVDIASGPGVDVVLEDPYAFPFADETFDAVVSTSCFEHDDMFWLTFLEMVRVSRPSGLLYLNVPSVGPYHPHPGDCWRFYRDAAKALRKWATRNECEVQVVEAFIGPRGQGPWHDNIMIFSKGDSAPPCANISRFVDGGTPPPSWLAPG